LAASVEHHSGREVGAATRDFFPGKRFRPHPRDALATNLSSRFPLPILVYCPGKLERLTAEKPKGAADGEVAV
jgi:hypothetical protein